MRSVPAFKEKLVRSPLDREAYPRQVNLQPFVDLVKLFEFETNKHFIVRKGDPPSVGSADLKLFTNAVDTCRVVKGLFDELETVYAIRAPVQFVVAKDENGQRIFYILTKRVLEAKIGELMGDEKRKAALDMQKIFESLITYYEKKNETGEYFLHDLPDPDQYVYGNLENHFERRWYLVDTDPYYSNETKELWDLLDCWANVMDMFEQQFTIDLDSVRQRCIALRDSLSLNAAS